MADPKFTSTSILAAKQDPDVFNRLVALGEALGHTQAEIQTHMTRIVCSPVDDAGNTVASIFEYARQTYVPVPAPGADEAKLRDDQLVSALKDVLVTPAGNA